MGRDTKFTPEVREIILEAIGEGNYLKTAAECAGVGMTTLQTWLARGKSNSPEDAEHRAFRIAVKRAQADAERSLVNKITIASIEAWQAAAWLLERKNWKRWGKKDRVELNSPDVKKMTDEELVALVKGKGGSRN